MDLLGMDNEDGERIGSVALLLFMTGSDYGLLLWLLEILAVNTPYLSISSCFPSQYVTGSEYYIAGE